MQIWKLICCVAAIAIFTFAGPLQAALVLDDPLNGCTIAPSTGGAQQGGTFLPGGGWRVRRPATARMALRLHLLARRADPAGRVRIRRDRDRPR